MPRIPVAALSALVALLAAGPSAANAPADTPESAEPASAVPGVPPENQPLGAAVRQLLTTGKPRLTDADRADRTALASFYESHQDVPLWIDGAAPGTKAAALADEIRRAGDWGLEASEFDLPDLGETGATGTADQRNRLAAIEMQLSLAALKYARHARGGRIPDPAAQLSSYLDRTPQLRDPKVVLEELAAADDPAATLRGLHPKHAQFEKLRQKYLEMTQAVTSVEIVRIPPGPQLRPGDRHEHVALLRKRLEAPAVAVGGWPAEERHYDEALAVTVKAFQQGRGLMADGIVGSGTRAALNDFDVPSPAKLIANMEQWRWMPDDLGDLYVWVNIPEFTIRVVKAGQVIHEERVIAGQTDKQTPVFSDEMETIYIHPRWNVPDSIKVLELHPSLARGGTYFSRQGLRISRNGREIDPYSVDWAYTDIRNYDIYQPPGGGNVLGLVKFTFPNKHQVYMHDTPTKNLFNEASRTFSHGCMRVRNPVRLAEILLEADKGWGEAQVASLISAPPQENPLQLDRRIPVHVTYFTARVDEAGKEHVARDVYGHEKKITLALAGRFDQIVRGPDHLAPVKYAQGAPSYQSTGPGLDSIFTNFFGGF